VRPDGEIREALRRMAAKHITLTTRVPSAAALKEVKRYLPKAAA